MQITFYGLFVAILGIWCQFRPYHSVVVAMFGLVVLGAVAALDLPALGGASVTPANMFLLFYLLRLVSMRNGAGQLLSEMGPRRPLFIFFLLIVWIVAAAFLLPRLFDGATNVFSLSRTLDVEGTTPLHPTSGNLSQAVYAIGGFLVACATCAFARKPDSVPTLLNAIALVTSLHLFFALLDLVTSATHTGFILDVIHTANYAFLTDDELGGLKRISGSFSEASAFAQFSLTLLAVNFPLFIMKVRPRFTGVSSLLLTCFIVLSTSSAGYAGIAVFYSLFLAYALYAGFVRGRLRVLGIAVGTTGVGILLVSLVVLFLPTVADVAQGVISESLLNKGTTDSAVERGSWNSQALQVFHDTYWLGAGIGTTRGSNYALVLLSNLGIVGFALFALLVLRVTMSRVAPSADQERRGIVWGARIGLLTTLVPSVLIGTVFDLGTLFYCLVGIAAAGTTRHEPRMSTDAFARARRSDLAMSNASFSRGS